MIAHTINEYLFTEMSYLEWPFGEPSLWDYYLFRQLAISIFFMIPVGVNAFYITSLKKTNFSRKVGSVCASVAFLIIFMVAIYFAILIRERGISDIQEFFFPPLLIYFGTLQLYLASILLIAYDFNTGIPIHQPIGFIIASIVIEVLSGIVIQQPSGYMPFIEGFEGIQFIYLLNGVCVVFFNYTVFSAPWIPRHQRKKGSTAAKNRKDKQKIKV
jgi:hypothetical protein